MEEPEELPEIQRFGHKAFDVKGSNPRKLVRQGEEANMAIEEVLKVAAGVFKSRDEVARATNAMSAVMQGAKQYQVSQVPSGRRVIPQPRPIRSGLNLVKAYVWGHNLQPGTPKRVAINQNNEPQVRAAIAMCPSLKN